MEEMKAFCGRSARVYRVLDRVYDYGRSREMRRIDRSVLLVGLRCDGGAHDGCDAACYLVWKEAWLDRVAGDERHPLEALLCRGDRAPIDATFAANAPNSRPLRSRVLRRTARLVRTRSSAN